MSTNENRGAARAAVVGLSVAALCALAACGGGNNATTDSAAGTVGATSAATPVGATTAAQPATVEPKDYSDAQILGAQEGVDSMEIAVGKVAETHASNAGVKSFAKMIVADHEKALKDMKSLETKASASAQTPPGDTTSAATSHAVDQLNGLKGMDFDTAFVNHMVDGHKHAIDATKDMIDATKNTEVKTALQSSLPVLQKHLDRAQALQKELDKAKK